MLKIFSKYNRYILYIIAFKLLTKILFGLNHDEIFQEIRLANESFSKHIIIYKLFGYFVYIFLGLGLWKYEEYSSRSSKSESTLLQKTEKKYKSKNILIYNDPEERVISFIFLFKYLLTLFISIITEYCLDSYYIILQDLDFWMFELFILWLLNTFWLKEEVYTHQIIAIILNLISAVTKILSIIISFNDKNNDNDYTGNLPIFYKKDPFVIIPVGITIYTILIIVRPIVNLRIKRYMDLYYISPNKIITAYGILGTIICLFICILSTKFSCNDDLKQIKNVDDTLIIPNTTNILNISVYICKVYIYLNKTHINTSYFENYEVFGNNFNDPEFQEFENIFIEILVIIFSIISFFGKDYFSILVIKSLTPMHVIFSTPIFFFLQKVIMVIFTFFYNLFKSTGHYYIFKTNNSIKLQKLLYDLIGDLFSIVSFLIYLEIIVFKCKKLNYNTRLNIIKRGNKETNRRIDSSINNEIFEESEEHSSLLIEDN